MLASCLDRPNFYADSAEQVTEWIKNSNRRHS